MNLAYEGLSPRVRGNRTAAACLSLCCWSIPACAGNLLLSIFLGPAEPVYPRVCGGTCLWSLSVNRIPVYPRVCGGTSVGEHELTDRQRSIPRVRGNRGSKVAER